MADEETTESTTEETTEETEESKGTEVFEERLKAMSDEIAQGREERANLQGKLEAQVVAPAPATPDKVYTEAVLRAAVDEGTRPPWVRMYAPMSPET